MDAHPSHGKVYEVNVLARNDENELPVSKFVRDMALKLHKVTQAVEAPKESHSAQLCALQESQNAQHSELPGNCNSLRVHIARLQWRTTYIERRLMYETVVNASHAILGLLAPGGLPVASTARTMAHLSAAAFVARLPRSLVPHHADIHRVHRQFKDLVDFTIGRGLCRNSATHPRTWPEFYANHGTNIMDLMRTPHWREHPLANIAAFIVRVALFAQGQHEQEAQ